MTTGGEDSAPWLGLLKWSLQYTDGTKPSNETMSPMTTEDRAFLEAVMKDGVIDPAKRMKEILAHLNIWLRNFLGDGNDENKFNEDDMVDLLEELHEIVENIDFARDCVKMNGVPFLLGCSSERKVPRPVRLQCLNISSTLSQNNPPVQEAMLREHDALSILTNLYLTEMADDPGGSMRKCIVQALSCMVRSHRIGEESFCSNDSCRYVIEEGIGCHMPNDVHTQNSSLGLQKKCVFVLKALLHSDFSSSERINKFTLAIKRAIDFIDPENTSEADIDTKETTLDLLLGLVKQHKNVDAIVEEKKRIIQSGICRIQALQAITDPDEKEFIHEELKLWENIMVELAKLDVTDHESIESNTSKLMISSS